MKLVSVGALFALFFSSCGAQGDYGIDCSFPIHSLDMKCGDLLGDRMAVYEEFMQGCRDFYGRKADACDSYEHDRIEMSVRQPQSMVNYTKTGFMKIRAPEQVRKLLTEHWEKNKDKKKMERWTAGNIYTNHWAAPTYMVSVEDKKLRGGGVGLKNKIWDAAKETIEQWTGMEQKPTSMYGIRIYTEGAVLNPHVDRLPLVSSAIVNVAQDVDEPWPLEVYDRNNRAVNVTMEPGDMVLYESGSLIHGRPFPMKGRYYANIFIHFEPTGRPIFHHHDDEFSEDDLEDHFLPPYLLPDSPEIPNWTERNPQGWTRPSPSSAAVERPEAHVAASEGDINTLERLAKENKSALQYKDMNGWEPLHEAARAGHLDVIQLLVEHGADINARTHRGKGRTPLNLAITFLTEKHPAAQYLSSLGALDIQSEL